VIVISIFIKAVRSKIDQGCSLAFIIILSNLFLVTIKINNYCDVHIYDLSLNKFIIEVNVISVTLFDLLCSNMKRF